MKRYFSKGEIMKQRPYVIPMVLTMLCCGSFASGQTAAPGGTGDSNQDNCLNKDRFGFSYRMGLNISAKFKGLGGFQPLAGQTRRTLDGDLYNYDDGYNLVDSTGNAPLPSTFEPLTTYWGYDAASQVTAGNAAIIMHRSSSSSGATDDINDDPQHGFEITYRRVFCQTDKVYWGLEVGLGYTWVDVDDSSTVSSSVTREAYAFNLGGISPIPPPGYQGRYNPGGPAALLGATPTRRPDLDQTYAAGTAGAASISGHREITADLYGLRLGPSADICLGKGFSLGIGGGLAVVGVYGDFTYDDSVAIPNVGTAPTQSGKSSESDWMLGGYLSASLSYAISQSVDVSAGIQYQNVGTYTQKANGREVELDLRNTLFITLGIGYSF